MYKWLGRFAKWALEILKDLSRSHERVPVKIASLVEEFMVKIGKSRPYLGPIEIDEEIEQDGLWPCRKDCSQRDCVQ